MTFMKDYINFSDGGKMTFFISQNKSFTKPFVLLEYTTVKSGKDNVYNDSEEFCKAVKLYADSLIVK